MKNKNVRKDILLESAVSGNFDKFKKIFYKCHKNLSGEKLCNLVHEAYKSNNLEISDFLINEAIADEVKSVMLNYACDKNDVEFAKYLIPLVPDINARHKDYNYTSLHTATLHDNVELIELLLDNGSDINATGWLGRNALHYACKNVACKVIPILIERGIDLYALDDNGQNALHYACGSYSSGQFGLSSADDDIEENFDYENDENSEYFDNYEVSGRRKEGDYIFTKLDKPTSLDLVKYLMSFAFDINAKDKDGMTPLHHACNHNINTQVIKYLISNGANINSQDNKGQTVVHFAIETHGNFKMTKYLIEQGYNVNLKNNDGQTALMLACYDSELEIVKYLIKHGAVESINDVDDEGYSAFLRASYSHYDVDLEILKYLVEYGANIYQVNNKGENALHLVCGQYRCSVDLVKYLHSLKIDIYAKTNNGRTVLHYACSVENVTLAKYLMRIGIDINIRDNDGCNVLHAYCYHAWDLDMLKFLLNLGFDINEASYDGRTPLLYACYDSRIKVIEYLISRGANVFARSKDGKTALHLSCMDGLGFHDVEYFVNKGIDVNAQDDKGKTYLHYVIGNYGLDKDENTHYSIGHHVFDYLVAHGTDLSIKDNDGNTPLEAKRCSWCDNDDEDDV